MWTRRTPELEYLNPRGVMSGLGKLSASDIWVIAIVLEGFCYGLYSAIFFMYIHHEASKELGIDKRNIILYALCILYVLCSAEIVMDTTSFVLFESTIVNPGSSSTSLVLQSLHLSYVQITINGLCDFISQSILVYRCWVVWDRNIRVIIIPSILGLTFLATWLASNGSIYITPTVPGDLQMTYWGDTTFITSLAISLTVNAVVTGLIVLRILKVYWQVRISCDQTLGSGGHNPRLRSIIFILIESGMVLFAIQLIRIVLTVLTVDAFEIIVGINQMFNGIAPTVILVRVSAGLSFHDEKSMSEIVGTLDFGVSHSEDSIRETEDVEVVGVDHDLE